MRLKNKILSCKADKLVNEMIRLLPDWITGQSEIMLQKHKMKYGSNNCRVRIRELKSKTIRSYLITTLIFLVVVIFSVLANGNQGGEIREIKKPEYGDGSLTIPVQAEMSYEGIEDTKLISLRIGQTTLSKKQKEEILMQFRQELKSVILGENVDLRHVSKPLNLIDYDAETGITLTWTSSNPSVIDERGDIDLLAAENENIIQLNVTLTLEDTTENSSYLIEVDRSAAEDDYIRGMEKSLSIAVEQLSESNSAKYIILPDQLDNGMKVRWYAEKKNPFVMTIILYFVILLIIYMKRYDPINKEVKEAKNSITKELPELINKLVLLLNAGLVVSTAISKIVSDYESYYGTDKNRRIREGKYLYEELLDIQYKVNQSNVSLINELREFAQRSGVRDFVRLTAIISDNWNKGSTLAEKLETESVLLWNSRKKLAEERGRLAETKLTFPLMILLMVLIMVTIAPALMEM